MGSATANAASWSRLAPALVLILSLLVPGAAWGQANGQTSGPNILFSPTPSSRLISPEPAERGEIFGNGGTLTAPAPWPLAAPHEHSANPPTLMVPAGKAALALSARFGKGLPAIDGGLIWRVYAAKPDAKGNFHLVKEETAPSPTVVLPAGDYIVHVGFGLATAVKPVSLSGPTLREEFDLPAGALRMEGRVGDSPIPATQISFNVFKGSQFEPGANKRPVAEHVLTGELVVVPEGTYHIVSNYGDANAVVRSDIRVQAGKLTDVTITHRAAAITLKLVTQKGGEALANTAWSVLTPGGDVIKESIGAFPRVILAEGEYRAIARNEGKIYESEFKVVTGVDRDVEMLAK
jgi:hypothetical protein